MRTLVLIASLLSAVRAATNVTLDDSSPQIAYSGEWVVYDDHVIREQGTNYFNGSTHTTIVPGASAKLQFTGTAIYYYGDIDVDNAWFIINIDGSITNATSRSDNFKSQQLLFSQTGMSDTLHTFSITHADEAGTWMTLDRVVFTTDRNVADGAGSGSGSGSGDSGSLTQSSRLSSGAIAGAVIGAMLGALLLGFLLFFCARHIKQRMAKSHGSDSSSLSSRS